MIAAAAARMANADAYDAAVAVAGARELLEEYANTWAGNTPMPQAIRLILSAYARQGEENERLRGAIDAFLAAGGAGPMQGHYRFGVWSLDKLGAAFDIAARARQGGPDHG